MMMFFALSCCSFADAIVLLGKDFAFKSAGAESGSGGWEMKSGGYVGTIITLVKPGKIDLWFWGQAGRTQSYIFILMIKTLNRLLMTSGSILSRVRGNCRGWGNLAKCSRGSGCV